jgi:regulator of protease activity HflC (stomatin/prohibitin superfamily)
MRAIGKAKLVFVFVVLASGCGFFNPETPAGSEGYLRRGAIVGSVSFYGSQVGPASPGLGWLLSVDNVDFRWATYDEDFQVMSADNLSLSFSGHVVMRPKPGSVKDVVEVYGGSDWYKRNIKEPFRNAVYEAVAGYKALEAKEKRDEIADKVRAKFIGFLTGKPFEISQVVIGTINLPEAVAKAQEAKIAKETELERKKFEIEIATKEAQVRVEEAKGIAESQRIINTSLTAMYLQHEAIQAEISTANSPNHSTVYIPVGTNGLPLVKVVP